MVRNTVQQVYGRVFEVFGSAPMFFISCTSYVLLISHRIVLTLRVPMPKRFVCPRLRVAVVGNCTAYVGALLPDQSLAKFKAAHKYGFGLNISDGCITSISSN